MDSKRLEDCMLCGAASKEFALKSQICPTSNNYFCPCGELEQLEGQIRDFLHSALKKRQELRLRVNHFHNQNFHQTPPEVVSYIFLFYVSSVQLEQPVGPPRWCRPTKHRLSGPLVLGAVCRKWREIAWSTLTLELYNYISIPQVVQLTVASCQGVAGSVRATPSLNIYRHAEALSTQHGRQSTANDPPSQ